MAYRSARQGPSTDRPFFVITRAHQDAPRLLRITSQNNQNRSLYGRDMASGAVIRVPIDDALAMHEDETEAAACFCLLKEQLPDIDAAVYRARRAVQDAEQRRQREIRALAQGKALTP